MTDIQEKLRRLLRLGESSNQHEAANALAKAAELARKHSIDLSCLQDTVAEERIVESEFDGSIRAHRAVTEAALQICMRLFHCRALRTGPRKCTYVGIEHNSVAAQWAHGFIVNQCARDLARFRKAQLALTRRRVREDAVHQYCVAWCIAVIRKHDATEAARPPQLEDSKFALVLKTQAEKVNAYMDEKHGDLKTKNHRLIKPEGVAFAHGLADGKRVTVTTPLTPARDTLALL